MDVICQLFAFCIFLTFRSNSPRRQFFVVVAFQEPEPEPEPNAGPGTDGDREVSDEAGRSQGNAQALRALTRHGIGEICCCAHGRGGEGGGRHPKNKRRCCGALSRSRSLSGIYIYIELCLEIKLQKLLFRCAKLQYLNSVEHNESRIMFSSVSFHLSSLICHLSFSICPLPFASYH